MCINVVENFLNDYIHLILAIIDTNVRGPSYEDKIMQRPVTRVHSYRFIHYATCTRGRRVCGGRRGGGRGGGRSLSSRLLDASA